MLLLILSTAYAATYSVSASGGADYTRIQSAINAARSGDTIRVAPGTYAENIDTSGKNLTIEGTGGSGQTTIDGSSGDHVVEISSGERVTLRGFELTGGSHGVELRGSQLTAEDIVVTGVTGASPGGGFNVVDASTLTLDTCTIEGAALTNSRYGGGFFIEESTADISNCVVEGNSAYQGGGAYIWDSTVTFTDTDFIDNQVDWRGGGLRIREGSDVTLVRVEITGSVAPDKGGGVNCEDSDLTARNSVLSGNSAGGAGGGISFERSATSAGLVFRGDITDNTSGGGGGGVYAFNANVELDGSVADNTLGSPSSTFGGGVYFGGGDLTLTDCDVSGHRALAGAGVYVTGASGGALTVTNGSFSNNSAIGDGGGLWTSMPLTLDGTTFDGNDAGNDGGGLFVDQVYSELDWAVFTGNTAGTDGGGIEVYRAETYIRRSVFEGNVAAADGGAIHHLAVNVSGADLTLAQNEFARNRASEGGGVYADASRRAVSRLNRYEENRPNGATFASPNALVVRFETYLSNVGDGLNITNAGSGYIESSRFLGNQGDGAEISASSGYAVYNSVFNGNDDAGLRLYAVSDSTSVENIDAIDNDVGVQVQSGANVDIRNAIIAYNRVGVEALSSSPTLSYSDRFDNNNHTSGDVQLSGGNISLDPQYTGWSDDNNPVNDIVYLSSTSPARDAGDPSLSDPDGSRSDMGSFGGALANDDDSDGDGYHPSDGDCDEDDATVHPGATDTWYDGVDSNCDGLDDYDRDRDGHRHSSGGGGDCDDTDASVHPGADDPAGDGVDADCDGEDGVDTGDPGDDTGAPGDDSGPADDSADTGDGYWTDNDGDGFSPSQGDCDDADPGSSPSQDEICDDGADNDCDGRTDGDDASCRGSASCACASGGAPEGGALLLLLGLSAALRRRRT